MQWERPSGSRKTQVPQAFSRGAQGKFPESTGGNILPAGRLGNLMVTDVLPAGRLAEAFARVISLRSVKVIATRGEAHGGRIWATANDDGRTTFHFTLPISRRVPSKNE